MVAQSGAREHFIHAGEQQPNGFVERCRTRSPRSAGTVVRAPPHPEQNRLRSDLLHYLDDYHADRCTRGRTPAGVIGKATRWS